MQEKRSKVLLVEDSRTIVFLVQALLDDVSSMTLDVAGTLSNGLERLASEEYDAVLLDLGLPDSVGLDTLKRLRSEVSTVPIIVMTGLEDEAAGSQAIRMGAQDFLCKSQLNRNVIIRSLTFAIERENQICNERLRPDVKAEGKRLQTLVSCSKGGHVVVDGTDVIRFINSTARALLGRSEGDGLDDLIRDVPLRINDKSVEIQIRRTQKSTSFVEASVVPIEWSGESAYLVTLQDITDKKRMEEAFEVSHRLLQVANQAHELTPLVETFLTEIKGFTLCDAVGIVLRNGEGKEPIVFTLGSGHGFGDQMLAFLSETNTDHCKQVMAGLLDIPHAAFTLSGSFYTNDLDRMVPAIGGGDARPFDLFQGAGYRSLAIVPLRTGKEICGFIHLADIDPDRITPRVVDFLESVTIQLFTTLQRLNSEKDLRESEARYRLLAENVRDVIWTMDIDLRWTYISPAIITQRGYSPEEATDQRLDEIMTPESLELAMKTLAGVMEAKAFDETYTLELEMLCKGGGTVWTESNIGFIVDTQGRPVGILGISRDLSERRRAEEELRKKNIELLQAQKLESIGGLAAGIAHEINTPIQYVGDNIRFLRDSFDGIQDLLSKYETLRGAAGQREVYAGLDKELQERIEDLDMEYLSEEIPLAIGQSLEGVMRVADIVGAMKDFAYPDLTEKVTTNLNKAIESTITVSRNEWKYVADLEADLEADLDPALPLVPCLPGEFNQIMLNLIINASHAISDVIERGGYEKGTLMISTCHGDDFVEVRVSDTGTGIPAEIQSKIFDPFFTTKDIGKGTGQGLSIARSIVVEKHGGEMFFESEEGKGTTFFIRLPVSEEPIPEE